MAAARASFEKILRPVYSHYIGGVPRTPTLSSERLLPVVDKFTGKSLSSVVLANEDETVEAIRLAKAAEDGMRSMPNYRRRELLLEVAKELGRRQDELIGSIVYEVGKPIRDATVEVGRAIDTFTLAAEESIRRQGEFAPLDISARNAPYSMVSGWFPVGVVGMISPFNFPVNLVAHKIAPAIAAGCPFVLKPSERTPLGAFLIADVLHKVGGLPDGAWSVLLPADVQAAQQLVTHPDVSCFSFTGSPKVGWHLKSLASRKKVVLELGGNAACIVDRGADVKTAAERILFGAFYSMGQSCISVQRIYAHESVYAELRELLRTGAAALSAQRGDPFEQSTFLGPMIAAGEAQRLQAWVDEARAQGATVLTGGQRRDNVFDCTVVENVGDNGRLNRDEVFGPVCTLQPFTSIADVCRRVNDSEFGLQAGIFTNDINTAFYAFQNLHVGGVVVNDIPSVRVDSQPYGGIKASGVGREGIKDAIREFSEQKVMILKNLGKIQE